MTHSKTHKKRGEEKLLLKLLCFIKRFITNQFKLIFVIAFFLVTPLVPYFVSANVETVDSSAFKMTLALKKLFGQESEMYHSSLSSNATVLTHFIIDYISMMLSVLVVTLTIYNLIRFGINLASRGFGESQMTSAKRYGIKALCFVFLAGCLSPAMSLERKLPNGSVSHIPIYQVFGEHILIGFSFAIEKLSSKKDMKDFLITDYEVKSKFTIQDDVIDFTQAYLSTGFDDESMKAIQIIETDRLFQTDIKMGGEYYTYKFNKNIDTHSKALEIGIDLSKLENQFVQDYFKALTDNAYGVKKAIQNTTFMGNNIFSSYMMRNQEPQFQKNYKLYCDNLYEPISKLSNTELNSYIIISAKCTSDKFMKKHYANGYWDYDEVVSGATKLPVNYTLYFGNDILRLNIDEVLEATSEVCKTGYLACVDTIPFSHRKYLLANSNHGLSSSITRHTSRIFDISVNGLDVLSSRVIEVNEAKTDDYESVSINSDLVVSESVVEFKTMPGNFNKRMAKNPLEYADFDSLNLPSSPDEMFRAVVGKKPEYIYNRFKTCVAYPDQLKNGFRCENTTAELSRFAVTGLETGLRIYMGGKVLETFIAKKNKKKKSAVELGNAKAKKMAAKMVGISITTYFASYGETPFFESGYYSGETVNAYLIVMAILIVFGVDASGMTALGLLLMVGSGFALLLLFTPFIAFIKFIISGMVRILLSLTIFLGMRLIKGADSDKGFIEGFLEVLSSNLVDMTKVAVAIVFFKGLDSYMDVMFGVMIRETFEIIEFEVSGIIDIILNAPSLIMIMMMLWLMMMTLMRDHFEQNINQAIK